MRVVRQHRKTRSNQAAPKARNNSAQLALNILGCCLKLRQRNYSPVPLVQRRKDQPFHRRQPIPPPILENNREVLPIYTGISIHQIRDGDLGTAPPAKRLLGLAPIQAWILQFFSPAGAAGGDALAREAYVRRT
jgi:hypothetical protein